MRRPLRRQIEQGKFALFFEKRARKLAVAIGVSKRISAFLKSSFIFSKRLFNHESSTLLLFGCLDFFAQFIRILGL